MSFGLSLTYTGVKGSQSALKQFEQDISQTVTDWLETMGQIVVEEMQGLVPVDTGALQESIGYSVSGTDLTFEATEDYAGFVEYGTSKMEAQPYFNPPLDNLHSSGIGDEFGRDALSHWNELVSQYENQ
jgi:HK97 gp10 family phage protein